MSNGQWDRIQENKQEKKNKKKKEKKNNNNKKKTKTMQIVEKCACSLVVSFGANVPRKRPEPQFLCLLS